MESVLRGGHGGALYTGDVGHWRLIVGGHWRLIVGDPWRLIVGDHWRLIATWYHG